MKKLLLILAIFAGCGVASAQEFEETLVVYFRTGSAWFIPQMRDNGARAEEFFETINKLQNTPGVDITSFELIGSCSPDGTKEYNDFLANRRCMFFYERFSTELNYPINQITFKNESEDWDKIAEFTLDDEQIALRREAVRTIRKGEPGIIQRLQNLDNGRTYQQIFDRIFPEVRTLTVKVRYAMAGERVVKAPVVVEEEVVVEEYVPVPKKQKPVRTRANHHDKGMTLDLKTNAATWLLGVSNVAVECSVSDNLAINLPIYFSGWDNKLFTFNFRGLVIQPEFRFYVPKTSGFFVGAHAGVAWFNCSGAGDYRYQNPGWNRPTFGGGLNVGYRLPLKKNSGWNVEFGIGAGVYDVNYDVFYNEGNGPFVSRNQYTLYYGIDQAQISFLYSFKLGKKGGR